MFNLKSMIALIGLAAMGAWIAACGSPTLSNVTTVSMESDGSTCSPNKIDTAQGFLVKISLKNTGTNEVAFVFADAPYQFTAQPGQTALGNFTAPTQVGTYKFQCGATGNPQTEGTIQVRNSQ